LAIITCCLCFRMLPECSNFSSSVSEYNECELKIKEEPVAAPKVKLINLVSYSGILAAFLHESFSCLLNFCFLWLLRRKEEHPHRAGTSQLRSWIRCHR
jgi:hypothetical protein